jgi:hypothetical protein
MDRRKARAIARNYCKNGHIPAFQKGDVDSPTAKAPCPWRAYGYNEGEPLCKACGLVEENNAQEDNISED